MMGEPGKRASLLLLSGGDGGREGAAKVDKATVGERTVGRDEGGAVGGGEGGGGVIMVSFEGRGGGCHCERLRRAGCTSGRGWFEESRCVPFD